MKRALENRAENVRAEERLFNFRPALFAAIFLCLGILTGYFCVIDGGSAWWTFCIVPLLCPSFFLIKSKKRAAIGVAILTVAFAIGFGSFALTLREYRALPNFSGECTVTGLVIEKRSYEESTVLVLTDVFVDGKSTDGKLVAYMGGEFLQNVRLSDEVTLKGNVRTDVSGVGENGLRASEIADGIKYAVYSVEGASVTGRSFRLGLWIKERISLTLDKGMSPTSAALTLALLTGDTSQIGRGLLEGVRYGGIAHIFAVSGMHIGALYAFCRMLIDKTKLKKLSSPARFLCVAAVLVFYGYICGFSASVTRAIFLCLITYACALFGITSDFLDSLGVALFFVLVYSPTLLFEVGCLLSFSACFGIALLSRRINGVLEGAGTRLRKIFVRESPQTNGWLPPEDDPPTVIEYFIKRLNALISVSLAAQLATAPVQRYFFGYVSLAGLAFNLIFVPLVGMCFGGLLCLTAIACCLPVLSGFLLYAPSVVWLGLTLIFEIMDFSTYALTCEYVPFGSVLAYYTTLVLLSDKINLKGLRIFYVLAGLACAAVGFLAGMA